MKTIIATTLALMVSAVPVSAERLYSFLPDNYVKRTSEQVGNSFLPTLTVRVNGISTEYSMGENGLTRSIVFNPDKAVAWASNLTGTDVRAVGRTDSESEYPCGDPLFCDREITRTIDW